MPVKKREAAPTRPEVTVIYPHQLFEHHPALSRERPVILAEDQRKIPKSLTKCPQKQQRERFP
jgi:hypothetical protein